MKEAIWNRLDEDDMDNIKIAALQTAYAVVNEGAVTNHDERLAFAMKMIDNADQVIAKRLMWFVYASSQLFFDEQVLDDKGKVIKGDNKLHYKEAGGAAAKEPSMSLQNAKDLWSAHWNVFAGITS